MSTVCRPCSWTRTTRFAGASDMSRIVIVGGGIIGLCAAYYATEAGLDVTLIERGSPDHDSCSLGNAGMICPSHFIPFAAPGMVELGLKMLPNPESPFALKPQLSTDWLDWNLKFVQHCTTAHVNRSAPLLRDLLLKSRSLYEELETALPQGFGLEKRGLLMLCKTEEALSEEAHLAKQATELGIPADVLTPEALAKLEPGIRFDVAGGVYFPLDCHLTPQRLITVLRDELTRRGVTFLWNTEAKGFQKERDRIVAVQTSNGEVSGDEFVLAGGAWTGDVARALGVYLPMLAGKGYSQTLKSPRELPKICSILVEARVAVTPMGETLRFAGTMELTGNDLSVNPARVRGIQKSIPKYFPSFAPEDFAETPVWSGLRPCSPDGLPYLGRTGKWTNVLVAAGHAMLGISQGPITGMLLAELLVDKAPSVDIALLSPDRYTK